MVILSPKVGTFAARFVDSGASVRVGEIEGLLNEIRDVFCILCNTIMTAHIVVEMARRVHPVVWILHEWWDDDMIVENLKIRNYQNLTLATVKEALATASKVVFVCESQRQLYRPMAPSAVIFVGVPDPLPRHITSDGSEPASLMSIAECRMRSQSRTELYQAGVEEGQGLPPTGLSFTSNSPVPVIQGIALNTTNGFNNSSNTGNNSGSNSNPGTPRPCTPRKDPTLFTFLCLGIVCPRKNQLWTVQLFKEFARDKPNARLKVVGARYTRVYEIEYLDQVRREIDGDSRIELIDVTDNVDPYYQIADALILTSLNEVTPMVISEAFSWSIPVLSTNIAGIPEMYTDGQEGFLFAPGDTHKALAGMEAVYGNRKLRQKMAVKARVRFETFFDLDVMVDSYRKIMLVVAPPVILLDMDGCLVDWDKGFMKAWNITNYCSIDRTKSYYMEDCVDDISHRKDAISCYKTQGFFEQLEPMEGALDAIAGMEEEGLQLLICTSPVKHSKFCAQEKLNWIAAHLGEEWLDRVVLCQDKVRYLGKNVKVYYFMYFNYSLVEYHVIWVPVC